MIVKGKDVIGLKVVTVDTGTVIETVDDIAYDPINHRITALLVDSGGLFSSAKAIHIDDVRNIGEDAVIVHDDSAIRSTKELSSDVRSISDSNKHLVKTNVLTIDGKELGKVTDIFFDSANGYVESMEVSQGGLKIMTEGKKSIKPSDIVTIGADATIVSTYTEAKLESQGEEGGLKGVFNDAKDKTEELASNAKETIQDATDKTVDAAKEATETVKEKSAELRDKTEAKAMELREATEEKAGELKVAAQEKAEDTRATLSEKAKEARSKADELKDDVSDKTDELIVATREKAVDLNAASRSTRDELQEKVVDLSDEVIRKAEDVHATANDKAKQAKLKIDDLANNAKRNVHNEEKDIKTKISSKSGSYRTAGGAMVDKTAQIYEDKDKIVQTQKTTIK
ncbi:hypothetical protein EON76_02965 [bacterium]|nr:MAG: hypothetical protein EON76_02965 [bacterium]